MLIPIGVDVPFDRRPYINWLVVFATVVVFGLQILAAASGEGEAMREYLLNEKGPYLKGLFGHMWIHAGLFHIFGNMLFLWVFGNAVCSKIGNGKYLPVYIFLGLAAALTFDMFSDSPMLGASGAVNGIVGMYLIFFPLNDITCLWWFGVFFVRQFSLSSFWMILFWLAFDIFGVVNGGGAVAYTAHLGGFFAGIIIAVVLLKLQIVQMEDDERSLLQVFGINLAPKRKSKKREYVAPSGPREEAILRAAMDRKEADQENDYEEDYEMENHPARHAVRFSYQQKDYDDEPVEAAVVDDGYIRFSCECGKRLKVPGSYAGKIGKCPKCKSRVLVPGGI